MKYISIIGITLALTFSTGFTYNIWKASPNITCSGTIQVPTNSVKESNDPSLLKTAVLNSGSGGICEGVVFEVTKPITVYRAWNSTYAASRLKNWWTFDQPTGTLKDYRKDYEICCQWGLRDIIEVCSLQPSAKIVVGPGQSVDCSKDTNRNPSPCCDTTYDISPKNQVYIANPSQDLINCHSTKAPW